MKLRVEERITLASGRRCTVRIECEGGPVDTGKLVQDVGAALLDGDAAGHDPAQGRAMDGDPNGDTPGHDPHITGEGPEGHDHPDYDIKIHGKAKNTVHKVVLALDQRAARGTPATVDDIERGTGLSRPAIYRVLDPDTPQGKYARGLIRAEKEGNAYAIDITQAGRNMASRLRTRAI